MTRSRPWIFAAGLTLVFAFAVITRGGHLRVFWPAISLIVALMFAVHLVLHIRDEEPIPLNPATDLFLAGFLGWAILSIFSSVNPEQSRFEVLKLASYLMVYFLAATALPRAAPRKALVALLAAVVLLEAAYGLLDQLSGNPPLTLWWLDLPTSPDRAHGTFANSNHFAALMGMGAFIAMGAALGISGDRNSPSEVWSQRGILALASSIMALAMVLGLSRGAWASFAAGLVLFFMLLWPRFSRTGVVAAAVVLVVAVVIGTFFLKVDQKSLDLGMKRVEEISSPEELNRNERISVWKSAAAMIQDHPFTGTGWGTFHSVYPSYRRDGIYVGFVFAHNDYLQIAAGMGVPGLIFFLGFNLMVFREGIKVIAAREDDFITRAMPGILAALFTVLVHELVDFNLMSPSHAILFFALSGLVVAQARGQA